MAVGTSPIGAPPAARVPGLLSLEIFIDLPNFERALKRASLPHQIDLPAFADAIAKNLGGVPYFVKRINCFTATGVFDPLGRPRPEGFHTQLAQLPGVHFTFGHRVAMEDTRGATTGEPQSSIGSEKGVDVALAVSMVERACDGDYDAALLIANDSDYCGLIRAVQDRGKRVFWGHLKDQQDHRRMRDACRSPYLLSASLVRAHPLKLSGGR